MPHDIFISYSSKDKEKADQLSELLASAGLSVWIDQSGIDVATSWSGEIVDAIEGCKAFVILLSPNSIESKNVVKELALASERNKKILPLDLEPVALPRDLAYHLAGIQRAPMTNIDSIIRALGKIGLEATQAPTLKLVKETDSRKSLMILPFEDLSPTGDNGWFADGIVSEMISSLSQVKALHLMDAQTTKNFKRYQGTLPIYAREMNIRFFIQGDVRKFGDNIKITTRLLDIETGDHLWQDSMKGVMNDIFEIQEAVALRVVEGLKVHLASDEKKKLAEHGTENAEAYELYLKANEYFSRNTKEGFRLAIELLTEAIHLDPRYAEAYQSKANAIISYYHAYEQTSSLLEESEMLVKEALRLKPGLSAVYQSLSLMYLERGELVKAEEAAKEFIRKDPTNPSSHGTLGLIYTGIGEPAKAIAPYEEAVRLKPDHIAILLNLVAACGDADEREKSARWANVALPYFERHLKLHPDDQNARVGRAKLLFFSGNTGKARAEAMKLTFLKDGKLLYNTACIFARLGDWWEALRTLQKAIEAGFRNNSYLKDFLTDEKDGIASLAGTPEYEEVKRMVEEIEAEKKTSG